VLVFIYPVFSVKKYACHTVAIAQIINEPVSFMEAVELDGREQPKVTPIRRDYIY